MKKNFLRIFVTVSIVLALLFVVVLLVAIFGGITSEQFHNDLVKGLFVSLGVVFLACSVATLILAYVNEENVKEIVLQAGEDGGTRTTVGVVKKLAKNTIKLEEGVRCAKCVIIANEYGVRLKVTIKVKNVDVAVAESHVRALLEDAFLGALNYRFRSIEIKIAKLKPAYVVPVTSVLADADAAREEKEEEPLSESPAPAEEPAETPSEPLPVEESAKEESVAESYPDEPAETEKPDLPDDETL